MNRVDIPAVLLQLIRTHVTYFQGSRKMIKAIKKIPFYGLTQYSSTTLLQASLKKSGKLLSTLTYMCTIFLVVVVALGLI